MVFQCENCSVCLNTIFPTVLENKSMPEELCLSTSWKLSLCYSVFPNQDLHLTHVSVLKPLGSKHSHHLSFFKYVISEVWLTVFQSILLDIFIFSQFLQSFLCNGTKNSWFIPCTASTVLWKLHYFLPCSTYDPEHLSCIWGQGGYHLQVFPAGFSVSIFYFFMVFVSSSVFYTNACHVLALYYSDLYKSPCSLTFSCLFADTLVLM